jgi:hypothetical protein
VRGLSRPWLAVWLCASAHAAAAATVMPLSFENGNVLVAARLGDVPLRLIVDTGGKGTLQLTATGLAKVRVAMKSGETTRIDAQGNRFSGQAFDVPEILIGGAVFRDIVGFVRGEAASGITGSLPADGLLGAEFLRPHIARFDYAASTLTLFRDDEREAATAACAGSEIPVFDHPLGFWVSHATTDHGRLRFVWDTGATFSFISAESASSSGLPVKDDVYLTQHLKLGNTDYGSLELVVFDMHVPDVDMLLGYNFFRNHVVCFDGPRAAVTVRD